MNPRRVATLLVNPRGYVLVIVLIIGVAAGAGALALMSTAGGSRISATTSDLGDRSHSMAEAGMQRAVFYLDQVVRSYGDFDGALDTDLDSISIVNNACTPRDEDFRPDTSSDADDIEEWTSGVRNIIGGVNYTCVSQSIPNSPSGRYCVRFEDDDDDAIVNDDWWVTTGNNEWNATSGSHDGKSHDGKICKSDSNGCKEGPAVANVHSYCYRLCKNATHVHHNNGRHNGLRDRNRTIWVTAIGIYPDVDADDGDTINLEEVKYKTKIRRLHTSPKKPIPVGLEVNGDIKNGGAAGFYACSDIAAVSIDGDVDGKAEAQSCFPGYSAANEWKNTDVCDPDNDCHWAGADGFDGDIAIESLEGVLEEPGAPVESMPDVWHRAGKHIDFGRECVFWVEANYDDCSAVPTGDVDADGGPVTADVDCSIVQKRVITDNATQSNMASLWWWDEDESRGPNGKRCGLYETEQSAGGMPGPPDPSKAGASCADESDPLCWAGCWSPLILNMNSVASESEPASAGADWEAGGCWGLPLRKNLNCSEVPFDEAGLDSDGNCAWTPSNEDGRYRSSGVDGASSESYSRYGQNDSTDCQATATVTYDDGSSITHYDGLNLKLKHLKLDPFPRDTRFSKPKWAEACFIEYPFEDQVVAGVTLEKKRFDCCDGDGGGTCTAPSCDGNTPVMRYENAARGAIFFEFKSSAAVKAVPTGVYIFSGDDPPLNQFNWASGNGKNATIHNAVSTSSDSALPWRSHNGKSGLKDWPNLTIYGPGEINVRGAGYTFGIGQQGPGAGNVNDTPQWGVYPSFITGQELLLQGGSSSAAAGSIYAQEGAEWEGGGEYTVFGLLFSNELFELKGSAGLRWLYRVNMKPPPPATYAGGNASQTITSP